MAAVLAVTTVRARDGRFQDLVANLAKLRKIIERAGGKYRVVSQMYGATPTTVTTIVETASWTEFGALGEKLENDADYQAIIAEARANPWGDIIARGVSTEIAV
jgi:hypothetical protein